jgi:hypothetical protein
VIDYQFPGVGFPRYQEWYGGASLDEVWGSPALVVSSGLNNRTGTLFVLSMSWALPVELPRSEGVTLMMEAGLGDSRWNGYWYGRPKAGLANFLLRAEASFDAGGGWSVTPGLNWSTLLDDKLNEGMPRRTNTWLSLNFSKSF